MSLWISSENLIYDVQGVATADTDAREIGEMYKRNWLATLKTERG